MRPGSLPVGLGASGGSHLPHTGDACRARAPLSTMSSPHTPSEQWAARSGPRDACSAMLRRWQCERLLHVERL